MSPEARRVVPRSLQTPPEAHDDYAAVMLVEAALAGVVLFDLHGTV